MKHLIQSIIYHNLLADGWRRMAMIPGTATLNIETADTENGPVTTFNLRAHVAGRYRTTRTLEGDLILVVTYDSGRRETIGTEDLPVRLTLSDTGALNIACTWKKPAGPVL